MEEKNCIYNGNKVTERQFWKYRLLEVIDGGCTLAALQDLKTDLDMNLDMDDHDWQLEECLNGRR